MQRFPQVRFSAYRSAMKLREVQKALGLHYLNLNVAIEAFDAHGLRGQNDKLLDVPDMITVLSSLYETISAAHPTAVNVPLCLDLTLNWMLNVYDWYVYCILHIIIPLKYLVCALVEFGV